MESILDIRGLTKTYAGGFTALSGVDLAIRKGEIFALLGPNGAGKTTLIGAVCGLVRPTSGTIEAFGAGYGRELADASRAHRSGAAGTGDRHVRTGAADGSLFARAVWSGAQSGQDRGNPARAKPVGQEDAQLRALSGGMKRRVLIAKALAHEPDLLFLDEPTAGVDVELRRDMWKQIAALRERGTTIILTTHYIEEAEEMADRVGIIRGGRILMVERRRT